MGETLYSDVIYVAVNQYVPESELNLLWTLKALRVKKLCLLQVLIPFSPNPCKYILYILLYVLFCFFFWFGWFKSHKRFMDQYIILWRIDCVFFFLTIRWQSQDDTILSLGIYYTSEYMNIFGNILRKHIPNIHLYIDRKTWNPSYI